MEFYVAFPLVYLRPGFECHRESLLCYFKEFYCASWLLLSYSNEEMMLLLDIVSSKGVCDEVLHMFEIVLQTENVALFTKVFFFSFIFSLCLYRIKCLLSVDWLYFSSCSLNGSVNLFHHNGIGGGSQQLY